MIRATLRTLSLESNLLVIRATLTNEHRDRLSRTSDDEQLPASQSLNREEGKEGAECIDCNIDTVGQRVNTFEQPTTHDR